jgi:hypothetical protein
MNIINLLQINYIYSLINDTFCKCINNFNKKLITHEDPYHIHQFLGLASIISFTYRYTTSLDNLGFGSNLYIDIFTICIHTCLSLSSLIFKVLRKRIVNTPLVIYEEYRLHAIVFTMRGTSVALFYYIYSYFKLEINDLIHYSLLILVLSHHLIADKITQYYGTKGITAVRVNNVNHTLRLSLIIKYLYSFYQFLAISSHIRPGVQLLSMGFNTYIAIQSSAFMMTLRRKGLIQAKTHGIIYTFCLILSIYNMCIVYQATYFISLTLIAFIFRCKYSINKYVIWIVYGIITSPYIENKMLTIL